MRPSMAAAFERSGSKTLAYFVLKRRGLLEMRRLLLAGMRRWKRGTCIVPTPSNRGPKRPRGQGLTGFRDNHILWPLPPPHREN